MNVDYASMDAAWIGIIVGGESGAGARRCDLEWIGFIVDQCKAAKVACFVKQLGKCLRDGQALADHRFQGRQTSTISPTTSRSESIPPRPRGGDGSDGAGSSGTDGAACARVGAVRPVASTARILFSDTGSTAQMLILFTIQ